MALPQLVADEQRRSRRALDAYRASCTESDTHPLMLLTLRFECAQGGLCGCRKAAGSEAWTAAEKHWFIQRHPAAHVCADPDCQQRVSKSWFHQRTHVHPHGFNFLLAHAELPQHGGHMSAIADALAAHGDLRALRMVSCSLTAAAGTRLLRAAVLATAREIDLTGNNLAGVDGGVFEAVASLGTLRVLRLGSNALPAAAGCAIGLGLSRRRAALDMLHVGDNNLGDAGVRGMSAGAGHCVSVCLRANGLTPAAVGPLSDLAAAATTGLLTLQLKGNNLRRCMGVLAKGLRRSALENLELAECQLLPEDIAILADVAPALSLCTLNLNGNRVGDEGAEDVARLLRGSKLKTVGLRDTGISDAGGVVIVSAAVGSSVCLEGIDLSSNRCGDETLCALADALRGSHCMASLDLRGNRITARGSAALANALCWSRVSLTHVDLGDVPTDEMCVRVWCGALSTNRLRRLSLSCADLSKEQVQRLKAAAAGTGSTLSLSRAPRKCLRKELPYIDPRSVIDPWGPRSHSLPSCCSVSPGRRMCTPPPELVEPVSPSPRVLTPPPELLSVGDPSPGPRSVSARASTSMSTERRGGSVW
eukprot:TRINITY_DN8571_c0_g1_i1.p1 TRINITY_DN8571_c0_g1~~TRINITY_DN8571_c0_g1_i1.p1  ORF type:complete len:604 (+),score=127.33 TRINITY_DN8571_c0_g1_i1:41-1813(+)